MATECRRFGRRISGALFLVQVDLFTPDLGVQITLFSVMKRQTYKVNRKLSFDRLMSESELMETLNLAGICCRESKRRGLADERLLMSPSESPPKLWRRENTLEMGKEGSPVLAATALFQQEGAVPPPVPPRKDVDEPSSFRPHISPATLYESPSAVCIVATSPITLQGNFVRRAAVPPPIPQAKEGKTVSGTNLNAPALSQKEQVLQLSATQVSKFVRVRRMLSPGF